jgi:hypothetical protein
MDKDLLEKIEEYASLFFTVDEISLMLELDATVFRREVRSAKSEMAKAYHKGKLRTMIEIRRLTVEFAKKGSPQAEAFVKDYIEKQEENE